MLALFHQTHGEIAEAVAELQRDGVLDEVVRVDNNGSPVIVEGHDTKLADDFAQAKKS